MRVRLAATILAMLLGSQGTRIASSHSERSLERPEYSAGSARAAPEPGAAADVPPAVSADRELLERILAETRVERSPPSPSWTAYFTHLGITALRALARGVSPLLDWLASGHGVLAWIAWALLAALLLLLAWILVRALGRPRRRRAAPAGPELAAHVRTPPSRDLEVLRSELQARLRAGDVAEALTALWWWLALSLGGSVTSASWTTRELLERSGRRDLAAFARALDRMMYGPERPALAEVRHLLTDLQGALR